MNKAYNLARFLSQSNFPVTGVIVNASQALVFLETSTTTFVINEFDSGCEGFSERKIVGIGYKLPLDLFGGGSRSPVGVEPVMRESTGTIRVMGQPSANHGDVTAQNATVSTMVLPGWSGPVALTRITWPDYLKLLRELTSTAKLVNELIFRFLSLTFEGYEG